MNKKDKRRSESEEFVKNATSIISNSENNEQSSKKTCAGGCCHDCKNCQRHKKT